MKQSFGKRFEHGFAHLRKTIDHKLEAWGYWVFDHAWAVLIISALVLGGLMSQIPNMKVDTSTEGFLQEDDPFRVGYNAFRFQFGRDERAIVVVDSGKENAVFTLGFLEKLRDLHRELEAKVPKLQHVDSLVNARLTRGENDQLIVKDFLEDWPQQQADVDVLKERALSNEVYLNQFLSKDGRYAVIMIENDVYSSQGSDKEENVLDDFDSAAVNYTADNHPPFLTGEENTEIVLVIEDILKKHDSEGFRAHPAGTPFMIDILTRILMQDMTKFILLSMLVIAGLLTLIFRRVVMIFLPLSVAMLAMLSTMGVMALAGIPLTSAAQIMPSFLLTVGVANAVHIFSIFFQRSKAGDSKRDGLAHAIGHSGLAIVMTSFTTIAGLLSFSQSHVKPIADFGLITPLGVFNALLCSLVLLPALVALLPIKEHVDVRDHSEAFGQRVMAFCGKIAVDHPWKIVWIWGGIVAVALLIAMQMRFSHNPLNWFPKDDPFRVTTEIINNDLGGGMFLEVVFDTGVEDGLKDPEVLKRMDQIRDYAINKQHSSIRVEKVVSMVDIVKEINQALHNNDPAYYTIPDNRELLAQEILLFENSGSDDLEELVDSKFSKARMTFKVPFADAVLYPPFERDLYPKINEIMGDKAKVQVTGLLAMMSKTMNELIVSMAQSYASGAFFITGMMILFVGSLRIGLLSMVPNISPIIITMGIMVICDFPLDAFNLLIGSIGLGLAVDDTIHFMNTFQRNFYQSQNPRKAVLDTMATAGEAMFFTCTILSSAFFIYVFATMKNLQVFGMLTGMCILIAASADAFLNPALMYLYGKHKLKNAHKGEVQEFT
jgi:predicted RND superfamily exporter protein